MTDLTATPLSAADAIEINVPLHAERSATLRVIVASLGSDSGLSIDEIDDLKLAVSEAFTVLVDTSPAPTERGLVRYWADEDTVSVRLCRVGADEPPELDELAATILSSVVDQHSVDVDGIEFSKRSGERTT